VPTCQPFSETTPRTPGGFVQVPIAILTDECLSPGAKLFLAHLLRWDWGGGCWLTDKQLAHELGVTERTVRNHTKTLDEAGHLWVFEDREGMTVRLVVRPGHVYPRPPGMRPLAARKKFSKSGAPYKVLNHELEVHVLPTTGFEVDLSSVSPGQEPEPPVVCVSEPIAIEENPITEAQVIDQEREETPIQAASIAVEPETHALNTETPAIPVPPVVSEAQAIADELTAVGVAHSVAKDLAQKVSPTKVRAALRYVSGYRGEVLNPPGLLRHLLETAARLPRWCYPAAPRPPEMLIEARSPEGSDLDPASGVDREQRRAVSPHAALWARVSARLEGMMQRQSFQTWFVPAFIDRIESGVVVLNAPSHFCADWIEEHYAETVIEALRAEGVDVERVEVEV